MVNVLVDDWLYMDIDGQAGTFGREETQRNLKPKMKAVTAAFIDCETKIITVTQEQGPQKDAIVNAAFDQEYLIQEERVGPNPFQVTAAKKEKTEGIYHYFKPVAIQTLVPYAVSIRAFLKSRGLIPEDQCVVFLDDLKTQAVLTIFEGLKFTASRRISMRDMGYMISEIRRSQQGYLAQRTVESNEQEAKFVIVSNNREWLSAFIEQGLAKQEDIIHVHAPFAVLEGLKAAKFGMHFALPEDLLRRKKQAIFYRRLRLAFLALVPVIFGTGFYTMALIYKSDAAMKYKTLSEMHKRIEREIEEANQRKFKSMFKQGPSLDFDRIYYDFIQGIPDDYVINEFTIRQTPQKQMHFTAVIYPGNDHVAQRPFMSQGIFKNAQISRVPVKNALGEKIEISFDGQEGEL